MLSPPTDRLHKFLAIAGIALFIVGVTIPLERYDQAVRQFIEAKSRVMEVSAAQLRLSHLLDKLGSEKNGRAAGAPGSTSTAAADDGAQFTADLAKLEREIAELSVQAKKHLDLAEHAERIRAVWFVFGSVCILGGVALAVAGFAIWWRQPVNER